jgi:hypothetical protein
MFGDAKIIGDAGLYQTLQRISAEAKVNLPKYEYPDNVATVSSIQWFVEKGVSIRIDKKHTKHCRGLEAQKPHGKAILAAVFCFPTARRRRKRRRRKRRRRKRRRRKRRRRKRRRNG